MSAPSLIDIATSVRGGHRTARSIVEGALAEIAAQNPTANAFVAVDEALALAEADELDRRIAHREDVGPLAGVPLGVKDTEDAIGHRTTYGSRLWADASIASRDSVLVARLRAAGCVVVGKTNTPELAAKGTTDNPLFGITPNPIDPTRTAGGSSGGAAAAVATGMVPLATASDGGGSIRIPAAACGLPGFKPSLGRIPDGGPMPVDWGELTSRGVLTRTMAELIAVLDVIVGADPTDLRSLPTPTVPWSTALAEQPLPARVGWSPTLGYAEIDPQIESVCRAAVDRLAAAGVEVVEIPTVFASDPVGPWITLVASYLRRSIGDRDRDAMDPDVRNYVSFADTITTQQLIEAEDACHLLNLDLIAAFASCDLLLTPTLALDPALLGEDDSGFVRATYPFNLTRSPVGTIPVGTSAADMPISLQIAGPQHADLAVLQLMQHLETT
ncbi:MAG: Amidase [Ilumatobacteraceae bacterium]|nr:Amidase [Ilumatobacteraceae bacterium]